MPAAASRLMRRARRTRQRILLRLACASLLLALPLVGQAYLPASFGGVVTLPLSEQPLQLAPWRATRPSELQLGALLFDGLYRLHDGSPRPHLVAGKPVLQEGGRVWRLTLRSGVTLHDGHELSATDVVASLQRTQRGPHRYLLANVGSLTAEGKYVVVLRLRRPDARLPLLLTAPSTSIGVLRAGQLIGSGPFTLHRRSPQNVVLRAHGLCFAGRPYLDELRFKLFTRSSAEVASFQIGNTQLSFHGASVFGGTPRHKPEQASTPAVETLFLACGRGQGFCADRQLRAALAAAIDRKRLARLIGTASQPALGPVSRSLLRYRRPARGPFDRGAAARLKRAAAARHPELGSGRTRLSLLVDATASDDRVVAGQLVADLDRIGFAVTIDARPAAEFQRLVDAGSFDLALLRQTPQLGDGRLTLAGAFSLAGESSEAARCITRGCGAREARRFVARLPLLPLVHAATRIHYDARLAGLEIDPSGRLLLSRLFWLRGSRGGP